MTEKAPDVFNPKEFVKLGYEADTIYLTDEQIDETLETHTPVLTEQKDLFIDNGGEMNFLIEGDNLAALKILEKTHKGKIDVIYIDPPYNTLKNEKENRGKRWI